MLLLSGSVREELRSHARKGAPDEVCGILGGRKREVDHGNGNGNENGNGDRTRFETAHHVDRVIPTGNVAEDPRTRYEVDPAAAYRAFETIEDDGRTVVGFYHSHPRGPPGPSATDAAQAAWPGHSYVIVDLSGKTPTVDAWRWNGTEFRPEEIRGHDQ